MPTTQADTDPADSSGTPVPTTGVWGMQMLDERVYLVEYPGTWVLR